MQGDRWVIPIHMPGTLTADLAFRFVSDKDLQLEHVSGVGTGAAAAGLQLGTSVTAEAYLVKASIGISGTPVEFKRANFVGTQYPHILAGTIVVVTLDFDWNNGGGATAAAGVTLILSFSEG